MMSHDLLLADYAIPTLDTFENIMRTSQMLVQSMWDRQSPLLQLPHLKPEQLKHFRTKKVSMDEQCVSTVMLSYLAVLS